MSRLWRGIGRAIHHDFEVVIWDFSHTTEEEDSQQGLSLLEPPLLSRGLAVFALLVHSYPPLSKIAAFFRRHIRTLAAVNKPRLCGTSHDEAGILPTREHILHLGRCSVTGIEGAGGDVGAVLARLVRMKSGVVKLKFGFGRVLLEWRESGRNEGQREEFKAWRVPV